MPTSQVTVGPPTIQRGASSPRKEARAPKFTTVTAPDQEGRKRPQTLRAEEKVKTGQQAGRAAHPDQRARQAPPGAVPRARRARAAWGAPRASARSGQSDRQALRRERAQRTCLPRNAKSKKATESKRTLNGKRASPPPGVVCCAQASARRQFDRTVRSGAGSDRVATASG